MRTDCARHPPRLILKAEAVTGDSGRPLVTTFNDRGVGSRASVLSLLNPHLLQRGLLPSKECGGQ